MVKAAEAGLDRDTVLARRRRILIAIGGAVLVTLISAIAFGNVQLLLLNLLADAGLIWYVVMLLQIKARQAAAASVVGHSAAVPKLPRVVPSFRSYPTADEDPVNSLLIGREHG